MTIREQAIQLLYDLLPWASDESRQRKNLFTNTGDNLETATQLCVRGELMRLGGAKNVRADGFLVEMLPHHWLAAAYLDAAARRLGFSYRVDLNNRGGQAHEMVKLAIIAAESSIGE